MSPRVHEISSLEHVTPEQEIELRRGGTLRFSIDRAEKDHVLLHAVTLRLPGKSLDQHRMLFDKILVEIKTGKHETKLPGIGFAMPDVLLKFVSPINIQGLDPVEITLMVRESCAPLDSELVRVHLWFSKRKAH